MLSVVVTCQHVAQGSSSAPHQRDLSGRVGDVQVFSREIPGQVGQHMGRPRSAVRVAAGEIES